MVVRCVDAPRRGARFERSGAPRVSGPSRRRPRLRCRISQSLLRGTTKVATRFARLRRCLRPRSRSEILRAQCGTSDSDLVVN
ncbi:hypothetical protein BV133_3270 [Blastochloris viridis]|uniref:Uncharacterized protein n=1 Tax=Blastochloris viridis TaxID=1079 RepID=A0A182D6T3_BLAVI|nr:hypothetical protein BV133_3270 [Blastochloris viridis]